MSYDKSKIFLRFGKCVKLQNLLKDFRKTNLDNYNDEIVDLFDTSLDDRSILQDLLDGTHSIQEDLESWEGDKPITICDRIIDEYVKPLINSARTSSSDILDDLIDQMNDNSDKVQQNNVSCSEVTTEITNSNAGSLPKPTVDQMARKDNAFEIRCSSVSTQGEELWTVYSELLGTAPSLAQTDIEFTWAKAGITFKILSGSSILETFDYNNQYSNWSVSGFNVDNTNKGFLYPKLTKLPNGDGYSFYYLLELFKDEARTSANLVASGTRTTASGEIKFTEQNDSGISGTVDIDYSADESSSKILLPLFLEDDKFFFVTDSDETGKFLNFFRNEYEKALPAGTGPSVTIPDSWAE